MRTIVILLFFTCTSYATTDGPRIVDVLGSDSNFIYLSILDKSEAPEFLLQKYDVRKNELYSTDLYEIESINPWAITEKMKSKLKPVQVISKNTFNQIGYLVKCDNELKRQDFIGDKIYFWEISCIVEKDSRKLSQAEFPTVTYNQKVTPDYSFIDRIFQIDTDSFIIIFVHYRSTEGQRQEYPLFTTNPVLKGTFDINEIMEKFVK